LKQLSSTKFSYILHLKFHKILSILANSVGFAYSASPISCANFYSAMFHDEANKTVSAAGKQMQA